DDLLPAAPGHPDRRGVARAAVAGGVRSAPAGRHGACLDRRVRRHQDRRRLRLPRVRRRAVPLRGQVRLPLRLAVLLRGLRRGQRAPPPGQQLRHGPHRGALRHLPQPPGPPVRRRPADADRRPLLHQQRQHPPAAGGV
ncbi:MAG: Peptide-methionine (R)-S-oxide reductase MsrB, partial [uncultured Blastococcus sp.]